MVFEIPITEIRKAAELSVTPRNNYEMRRSSIRLKKKHSFISTDIKILLPTLAGGKLDKVDIGNVEALRGKVDTETEVLKVSKVAKVEQLPKPGLRKGCRGRARGRERWSATWEIRLVDSYGKPLGDINRWWLFGRRHQEISTEI